jgi:hypothetical protein
VVEIWQKLNNASVGLHNVVSLVLLLLVVVVVMVKVMVLMLMLLLVSCIKSVGLVEILYRM